MSGAWMGMVFSGSPNWVKSWRMALPVLLTSSSTANCM